MSQSNDTHAQLKITGMGCAACAVRIQERLGKLEGVGSAQVNVATEKLDIQWDLSRLSLEEVKTAVREVGYGVEELIPPREMSLEIKGMSCASCSARVEKTLTSLEGVMEASVNLVTGKAKILWQPDLIRASQIKLAIKKAGYTPGDTERSQAQQDLPSSQPRWNPRTRMFTAVAFASALQVVAMGHMLGLPLGPISPHHSPFVFTLLQLLLTLPVIFAGSRILARGFRNLVHLSPNMDSLIAVGSSSALVYSLVGTGLILQGELAGLDMLYYETAASILGFIMVGKYLEEHSKGKASTAIRALMELQPDLAKVVSDEGEIELPIDEIEPGDLLLIRPGERIALDGVVVEGSSGVDESMLTGESRHVTRSVGDQVIGGSVNQAGVLKVQVTRVGKDSTLARIIRLVEDAQAGKARLARLADRVSLYFVPVVMALALLSAGAWFFSGAGPGFSLSVFIAVLVVACPCALGLATPTAIMVGTGRGADLGVLIKGGSALEAMQKLDVMVLDKTGTITEGKPSITRVVSLSPDFTEEEILILSGSVEAASEHVLASAVVRELAGRGLSPRTATDHSVFTGRGIRARVGEHLVLVGSRALMTEFNITFPDLPGDDTQVLVAIDGKPAGSLTLADRIRTGSRAAVARLAELGIRTIMVTGDNPRTAAAVAASVGITEVIAEVLPEGKVEQIKALQRQGLRVAMVGDGINDAPALAAADVGMAIGTGTDVAMETAEVVLVKGSLGDAVTAIRLGRATVRNIRQNLFWAMGYNSAGIPLAAGLLHLFGGPLLSPMIAAGAMALSSVSVVTNALRLKSFRAE